MIRTLTPHDMFAPLARIAAQRVPFVIQKNLCERAFLRVFKTTLDEGELDFLDERTVALSVSDLQYTVNLGLRNKALVVMPNTFPAEVTISGGLEAFLQLATRQEDPDTLFFQRRLSIDGNVELGLQLKNVIDSIELSTLPPKLKTGLSKALGFSERFKKPIFS